jgi:hypothetical protein
MSIETTLIECDDGLFTPMTPSGTYGGYQWTNPSGIWNTTSGTYAYCSGALMNPPGYTGYNDYVVVYPSSVTLPSGVITKVEIGLKGHRNTEYFHHLYLRPTFSGSDWGVGDFYRIPLTTVTGTYHWQDITYTYGCPRAYPSEKTYRLLDDTRPWEDTDLLNIAIEVVGFRDSPFQDISDYGYIDLLWLKVTTSGIG